MKRFLFCLGALGLLGAVSPRLVAQQNGGLGQGGNQILATLSPADEQKFFTARTKALDDNPDLKAEGEDLMKQAPAMHGSEVPAEEKRAFMEKVAAHQHKLREIMLKEDPTLQPIFAQLDQTMGKLRALAEKKREEAEASQQNPGGGPGQ